MAFQSAFERQQSLNKHCAITPNTCSSGFARQKFPIQQKARLEAVSGLTAEDVSIHYGSVKHSAVRPVQFLKPLGVMSYLRSANVKEALGNYHAFCDGVPEADLLSWDVLDRLNEKLNAVQDVCEADNDLHRNLWMQVKLELSICNWLRGFRTEADNMANLISEEANQEQQDYIRRLYYASKIVDNREKMITDQLYNEGNFSFIERIFSAANTLVGVQDSHVAEQEGIAREKALVRLHVKRLYAILDDQDAPSELKNVISQILPLTSNIPVRYNMGGKSTTLMKPGRGAFMLPNPYEQANGGGEHSDLEFGVQRGSETVDTAHGSFLHELTHAAVQRTFHGTPLHLGFALPKRNKKKAIKSKFESVYKYRSGMIKKLNQLIQDEEGKGNFSKKQLAQLSEKLEYGAGRTMLSQYAIDIGNISDDDPRQGLQKDKKDLFREIEGELVDRQSQHTDYKIYGSVFMEYDATINQMLLWCYDWEIPRDNPVYRALAKAAQVEVNRRAHYTNTHTQAEA